MENEKLIQEPAAQQKLPEPVCPYCGLDPAMLNMHPVQAGNVHMMVIFCANQACRKLLPIHLLAIEQPRVALPNPTLLHPGGDRSRNA